jgi:hypothetical protein
VNIAKQSELLRAWPFGRDAPELMLVVGTMLMPSMSVWLDQKS